WRTISQPREFNTGTRRSETPAVISTSNGIAFVTPCRERDATMPKAIFQGVDSPRPVAEQYERVLQQRGADETSRPNVAALSGDVPEAFKHRGTIPELL